MKKLLLITGICCGMSHAFAQAPQDLQRSYQDAHHNVIGYLRDGSIIDKDNKFIGQFKPENKAYTVIGSNHKTIGYIVGGQEVQDANRKTVGYIKSDRTDYSTRVEDANHNLLGTIKADGTVENSSHTVIGYEVKSEPMWAGAYYFLLKF